MSFNNKDKPSWAASELPGSKPQPHPEVSKPTKKLDILKTLRTIGGLIVIAALLVVLWPIARPYAHGLIDHITSPSTEVKNGVYDFKQKISPEAPLGPVEKVTIRVSDGLAQAATGYNGNHFLESVAMSNVQYLGAAPRNMAPDSSALLCSVDLELVWADNAKDLGLTDPQQVLKRDTMEMISHEEWFSGKVPDTSFAEFSEDWSTATALFRCAPPGKLDTQRSGGFKVLFDYVVTSTDGETQIRNLATAPIYATDNGSLFIAEHDESNVTGWVHEGWDKWSQVSR